MHDFGDMSFSTANKFKNWTLYTFDVHQAGVNDINFSSDDNKFVSVASDNLIVVWNLVNLN